MTDLDLDDIRTRLAIAAADASKAIDESSQVARLVINDQLRDQFTDAGLVTMKDRLRVLRHALHDLESVHASLLRRADSAMGHPVAPGPADGPPVVAGPCRRCRREDAIVSVRVCMRCTQVARGEGARWASGQPTDRAVIAGRTRAGMSRRRPP